MNAPHEEWLSKAEDDLQFARVGLKEDFCAQVCFLSQQAIEKCLKGTLVKLGRSYPKTHSLRELFHLISEIKWDKWAEAITIIDGYYVPLRYPDAAAGSKASGPPNKEEAGEALQTAEEIFQVVTDFLFSLRG